MKRLLYILPLLFAALVSCEREIPYNGEYEDPKLVIQTSLCAGEDNFICYVNRSYFFLEHTNPNDKEETIKNPTFEIYSAQNKSLQIVSRIQSGNTHTISLSHPLQANDTIRLVVSHPTYGTATAKEVLMPTFAPTLKSSVWEPKKKQCRFMFDFPTQYERPDLVLYMKSSLYFTVRTIVTKERNDTILSCDTTDYVKTITNLKSNNKVFDSEKNNKYDNTQIYYGKVLYFNNAYLSSKGVEIYTDDILYAYDDTTTTTAKDSTITTRNYTYMLDSCVFDFEAQSPTKTIFNNSMAAYWGLNDDYYDEMDLGAILSDMIGMEEPVAVYSNVEGGYGIVSSVTRHTIIAKEIQKE